VAGMPVQQLSHRPGMSALPGDEWESWHGRWISCRERHADRGRVRAWARQPWSTLNRAQRDTRLITRRARRAAPGNWACRNFCADCKQWRAASVSRDLPTVP